MTRSTLTRFYNLNISFISLKRNWIYSIFKGQSNTNLMGIFVQVFCIKLSTHIDFDTRTKLLSIRDTKKAWISDLSLCKASAVELEFSTYFKSNSMSTFTTPAGFTRGFQSIRDTMIIRGSIMTQIVGSVNSNSIIKRRITNCSNISTDLRLFPFWVHFTARKSEKSLSSLP